MSHHADADSEFPEEAKALLNQRLHALATEAGAGPTGDHPRGRLHRTDEGGLAIAVTVERNTVIVAFGKPVSWFGMSRVETCELADLLKTRAQELS